jgi:hypothetical protein
MVWEALPPMPSSPSDLNVHSNAAHAAASLITKTKTRAILVDLTVRSIA